MKRSILPLVCSLMVFACSGQSSTSASISIDPAFMLSASFHGKNDGSWLQKITQVNVTVLDSKKASDAAQWNRLSRDLQDQQFEDLITYRKGSDKMQLLSKTGKDNLREIAFLAGSREGGLCIRFAGKFTQQDLDEMMSSLKDKNEQ